MSKKGSKLIVVCILTSGVTVFDKDVLVLISGCHSPLYNVIYLSSSLTATPKINTTMRASPKKQKLTELKFKLEHARRSRL